MEENNTPVNVLSDNEVDKLVEIMVEPQDKEVNEGCEEAPSNLTGEYKKAMVSVNPDTGETSILSTVDPDSEEFDKQTDAEFEEMLKKAESGERDPELDRDITESDVKNFYATKEANTFVDEVIAPDDLDPATISGLLKVANKKLNREKFNAYKEFPEKIQKYIDEYITKNIGAAYNINQIKQIRNFIAEQLLEEFTNNITIDRASKDINKEIENLFATEFPKLGNDIVGYTEERNAKYREYAQTIEDPEKKEKVLKILDRIDDAYRLDELIEFCKTCKIRSIDVEPKSLDSRNYIMDSFVNKYANSAYTIYDIYNVEKVLRRRLESEQITKKHIRAFLLAFCKYCTNFSCDNLMEHIFMYYTIYNIMLTDINTGIAPDTVDEEGNPVKDYSNISVAFLENIKKCINNLRIK